MPARVATLPTGPGEYGSVETEHIELDEIERREKLVGAAGGIKLVERIVDGERIVEKIARIGLPTKVGQAGDASID
jgi:hypothetical protein